MEPFVFPPFRLDSDNQCLWRESTVVPLRPKTFAVLHYLVAQQGRLVSTAELLQAVWPDVVVGEGMPRLCIRELRQALGDTVHQPRFIETQPRRGYRFMATLTTPVAPRAAARPSACLVGRDTALQQLHEAFLQACQGVRQLVFITGEPGIGKTTVVEAFLSQLSARPHAPYVTQGQCIEHYGAGEAYLPILEALQRLGQHLGHDALRTLLAQHAPTWLVSLPSLSTPGERQALQHQLAGAGQERMLRELAQALEHATRTVPLVLWLEDVHWSDQATLVLLTALARRPDTARLLMLATYRPATVHAQAQRLREVHQELQLHGYCTDIALPPLSATAVADYIAQQLGSERPSGAFLSGVVPLVHQRTGGNPLFMRHMLADLLTKGILVQRQGTWALHGTLAEVAAAVPSSLRQFLTQQFERLSVAEQRVLEAASAVGGEFSAAAVAAGLATAVLAVERRCAALARRGLFVQARGSETWPDGTVASRYGFLHALYHDVLYERLPAGHKVALHQRLSARYEQAYGSRASERAVELAMHCTRGHEPSKAAHYHAEAGTQALQRHAHHEAIGHLRSACALLTTLPDTPERAQRELALQMRLGTALQALHGHAAPDAEQAYGRALQLCQPLQEPRQLCGVLWGLRTYYNGRAEFHTARQVAEQLLAVAHQVAEPALLVEAHRALGNTLYFQGDVATAYAHFAQGIALYTLEQHRPLAMLYENDPGVGCLCFAAVALWNLGYPDRARQSLHRALQLAQDVAHPGSQAMALALAAALHQNLGEAHTTQAHAETLIALARTQAFAGWFANGLLYRGWALAQQGQAATGLQDMQQGLTILRTAGVMLNRPRFLMTLADAAGQGGQPLVGLTALSEALGLMQRTGGYLYQAELYRLYGELALQLGAEPGQMEAHPLLAEARRAPWSVTSPEAALQTARAMAQRQHAKSLELRATLSLARLWQQQGKAQEARQVVADVYGWFTEGFATSDLQAASRLIVGV